MAVTLIDAKGLQCPQPTLKVTAMSVKMKPGDVLEVVADCATFEKDVKEWCTRSKKVMLWMKSEGNAKRCQIQF
ncbi:MAG TPA: sulfurtransferase TusA family protein [Geobacteraceae bacterium]|nr:sulfurtransferase TusA family protein [Geobacteraceae bacterium]